MSTLDASIDRNRTALLRLLAVLFSVMRIEPGEVLAVIPKHLQSLVLWVLRPAEAAARRLVVLKAQGVVLPEAKAREKFAKKRKEPAEARKRAVSFELFDPLRSFDNPDPKPRYTKGFGPQITIFGVNDHLHYSPPPKPEPLPDNMVGGAHLCGRLIALQRVLEDLPKTAKRFVRMRARSARAPLRRGRPPGYRQRARHEVDQILRDCNAMAWFALEPLNSR